MVFFDSVNNIVNSFEIGIFATRTVGGIGEHGDFGLFIKINLVSYTGIFYNSVELFFVWKFVDAAIGKSKVIIVTWTFHDETTGEEVGF